MARSRYLIAAALTVFFVTTACARTGTPGTPDPAPPAPTDSPSVTVERSGGFAGRQESATVTADGAWTRSGHAGAPRSGRLTAEQHRELSRLVADPRLPEEARRTPGQTKCQDAFNYRVVIGTMTVSYADCPEDPDLPEAARAVVAFVETATAG